VAEMTENLQNNFLETEEDVKEWERMDD
jgi:hypothetical protein